MSRKFIRQYADAFGTFLEEAFGRRLFGSSATIPADGTAGFLPGAIWIDNDALTTATVYRNEGTVTSCAFKRMLSVTDIGSIDLSTLVATAAELNRAAQLSSRIVAAGAATLALTVAAHEGRTVVNDQVGGCTFTLPAGAASVLGARFRIWNSVTLTGGSLILNVANSSDFMVGEIVQGTDDATPYARCWETANTGTLATESDTITLNRTTTGTAKKGCWLEAEYVATNVWAVRGMTQATGSEATPFSAAV